MKIKQIIAIKTFFNNVLLGKQTKTHSLHVKIHYEAFKSFYAKKKKTYFLKELQKRFI